MALPNRGTWVGRYRRDLGCLLGRTYQWGFALHTHGPNIACPHKAAPLAWRKGMFAATIGQIPRSVTEVATRWVCEDAPLVHG